MVVGFALRHNIKVIPLGVISSGLDLVSNSSGIVTSKAQKLKRLYVFWSWPLARYWVFAWIADSSQVITLGEREGVHAKAKFRCKLNPDALLTFLPTYSFPIRKFLICCVHNLHNLGYSHQAWLYQKIMKPHVEQSHAHNWSVFDFVMQEKSLLFIHG